MPADGRYNPIDDPPDPLLDESRDGLGSLLLVDCDRQVLLIWRDDRGLWAKFLVVRDVDMSLEDRSPEEPKFMLSDASLSPTADYHAVYDALTDRVILVWVSANSDLRCRVVECSGEPRFTDGFEGGSQQLMDPDEMPSRPRLTMRGTREAEARCLVTYFAYVDRQRRVKWLFLGSNGAIAVHPDYLTTRGTQYLGADSAYDGKRDRFFVVFQNENEDQVDGVFLDFGNRPQPILTDPRDGVVKARPDDNDPGRVMTVRYEDRYGHWVRKVTRHESTRFSLSTDVPVRLASSQLSGGYALAYCEDVVMYFETDDPSDHTPPYSFPRSWGQMFTVELTWEGNPKPGRTDLVPRSPTCIRRSTVGAVGLDANAWFWLVCGAVLATNTSEECGSLPFVWFKTFPYPHSRRFQLSFRMYRVEEPEMTWTLIP